MEFAWAGPWVGRPLPVTSPAYAADDPIATSAAEPRPTAIILRTFIVILLPRGTLPHWSKTVAVHAQPRFECARTVRAVSDLARSPPSSSGGPCCCLSRLLAFRLSAFAR